MLIPLPFLLCAAMNVACWFSVCRWLPETEGHSPEEVETALQRPGGFKDNLDHTARLRFQGEAESAVVR